MTKLEKTHPALEILAGEIAEVMGEHANAVAEVQRCEGRLTELDRIRDKIAAALNGTGTLVPTRAMKRKRRSRAQIAADNEAATRKTIEAAAYGGVVGLWNAEFTPNPQGAQPVPVDGPQEIPKFLQRDTRSAEVDA